MSASAHIELLDIAKNFGGIQALKGVTLRIGRGSVHALVGENGAGKSTLMNVLAGVITDYEGRILLAGRPIRPAHVRDAEEAGIAMIHQELNLIPDLTVEENILLGREPAHLGFIDRREQSVRAWAALQAVGADVGLRVPVRDLRMGEKQLVEIAKALQRKATVLIMDEPTSALCDAEINNLFEIIRRLTEGGVTVIYISHKIEEIFAVSHFVTVLRDGRLVRTMETAATSPREIIHLMIGGKATRAARERPVRTDEEFIILEGLGFKSARKADLKGVNLSVRKGEILGIAGMLGAGKTELLGALFGLFGRETLGRVVIAGRETTLRSPTEAIAAGVAMLTEDRQAHGLIPNLGIKANMTISVLKRCSSGGLIAASEEYEMAATAGDRVLLKAPDLNAPVTTLSGGNQQKALLGRCLLLKPRLLLLDEPTRGIDVGAKAEVYALIRSLAAAGVTILAASSEVDELLALCDRIAVLREGRLQVVLDRNEATAESIFSHATGGAEKSLMEIDADRRYDQGE